MQNLKKNNKGFTLVELIVVIAILGVLMAVLVPQYIQYVEKSRIGADESAIGEVIHAAQIAIAEQAVYDEVVATNQTVTITVSDGAIACTTASGELEDAIEAACGTTVTIKSAKYKAYTSYAFDVTETGGVISVESFANGAWTA